MKKLLVALAMVSSSLVCAQTSKLEMVMHCFPLDDFINVLDEYDEQPLFVMDTMVNRGSRLVESQTIITVNLDTRKWSMYRQVDDETVCVQAAGKNFDFMEMPSATKKDML